MCNYDVLKGILSKKDRELLERDTYYKQEFGQEYNKEWYYGDDRVDELNNELDILINGYILEDCRDE